MKTKVIDNRLSEITRTFKTSGKTIEEKLIELFERNKEEGENQAHESTIKQ